MAGERSVKIKFIADKVNKFVADTLKAGGAMERWEKSADRMARAGTRVSAVTKTLVAPGAVPAVGALAVAGVGAASALTAAGAAVGVFAAVSKSALTPIKEAADKYQDLSDKIDLYGKEAEILAKQGKDNEKQLKKQAEAALELQARIALLPRAQQAAVTNMLGMRAAWQRFVDANSPAVYALFARGYALIRDNVGKLQPLFDVGRSAANRALRALERWADGGGVERLVTFLSDQAGPALESVQRIATNVFTFIGALFGKTVSQGQGLLDYLADASARLAAFGTGGGLERLVNYLSANGGAAGNALVQIGRAAVTIAQALGPLAPVTIAVADALAKIIAAMPPEVITGLVALWVGYTAAMTAYNLVLGATTVATKIATAATKAFGLVLRITPVGLLITLIALLVAGIIYLATKTQFFQTVWKHVWDTVKTVVSVVVAFWKNVVVPTWNSQINKLSTMIKALGVIFATWAQKAQAVVKAVQDKFAAFVNYFVNMRNRIASAAAGLFDGIKDAFRNAINYVIDAWNRLSFTLPSINTPFGKLGGTTLSTPNIGRLATGGWAQPGRTYLTGENGPELITTGRRAYVNSAGATAAMGAAPEVRVYIGERELTEIVDVQISNNNRQTRRRAGARTVGAFA